MTRTFSFRTAAIVALLMPGLVIAAPIAGPCGRCGDGESCHMQRPAQQTPENHSCCDAKSETPPEPTLGSSNCECGRETPAALTAESPNTVETTLATTKTQETISLTAPVGAAFSYSARWVAPTPAPPAYLIDCAFLT